MICSWCWEGASFLPSVTDGVIGEEGREHDVVTVKASGEEDESAMAAKPAHTASGEGGAADGDAVGAGRVRRDSNGGVLRTLPTREGGDHSPFVSFNVVPESQ